MLIAVKAETVTQLGIHCSALIYKFWGGGLLKTLNSPVGIGIVRLESKERDYQEEKSAKNGAAEWTQLMATSVK